MTTFHALRALDMMRPFEAEVSSIDQPMVVVFATAFWLICHILKTRLL
jgi:hypothetical protein